MLTQETIMPLFNRLPVIFFSLTVHEYCHAWAANRCGDSTARMQGRLTLNPLAHLSFLGTLCLLFGPIGWAKPVPINPNNFRNRRRGIWLTSAAGPASNLTLALICGLLLRGLVAWQPVDTPLLAIVVNFLYLGILINLCLGVFNLLPLYPLDGSHLLEVSLSPAGRQMYYRYAHYGPYILLGLIALPFLTDGRYNVLGAIIQAVYYNFLQIVVGI